ncbi:MAG: biopolymer transporter ExbD [Pseudomonadota bacterium]
MKKIRRKAERDPVISLINIVFLILIFFMVTGTLTNSDRDGISFVQTTDLECCQDGSALVVTDTGTLRYSGLVLPDVEAFLAARDDAETTTRLLPDSELPAIELLNIIKALREAGIEDILVVTENAQS